MKRYLILALLLCGFAPIYTEYENKDQIREEFKNVEQNTQGKQFTIVDSTPNLSDMQEGEIVILSSNTTRLIFRASNDLFSVLGSCITLRR